MSQTESFLPASERNAPTRAEIARFLEAEDYDLVSSSSRLDERLLAACDPIQARRLEKAWATRNEGLRLERLYSFPKTLKQAHLLFSHDRERIAQSFEWILASIPPQAKAIADVGCATGTLSRLIAQSHPSTRVWGIDKAANLVTAAKAASNPSNVQFEAINMSRLSSVGKFDVVVSACGIEQPYLPEPSFEDLMMTQGKGIMPGYRRTVASGYAGMLSGLRQAAHDGAYLIGVFRISSQTHFLTFTDVAAEIGWQLEGGLSKKLRVGNETFPGAVFVARAPGAPVDASVAAKFY
ncbi:MULTISPECIES: class I SAM-dependent methyltransferase [unclassified Mesorhizobium]|uniref:class I SAM-dependent methyltransferase n=2 Tax=Mesorhizobium TaxID=68287 RepID=UPI000FD8851C|nr:MULTISPECIES: class I SAM-dependent methyltransferase [unclassified Mesorhizobium]TGQ16369.1 class I SAM-dependent methyltransferase [Mesorhizobium sp. M2E.F.Ca.ET.219.01.1.1]TGT77534.1 class I SAM-dependent methyltransferase [Mesorhizobium sp. M2E.F.Ca.ET.166.01.1.1]TGW03643.1 class I SAM-dependent methyltransferase [Mesorhizobium sp. M2E.F.Ca.ET.154.01.1.1]